MTPPVIHAIKVLTVCKIQKEYGITLLHYKKVIESFALIRVGPISDNLYFNE